MRRPALMVRVAFEPGRLGVHAMADAYAQLVPIHKRRPARRGSTTAGVPQALTWSFRRIQR